MNSGISIFIHLYKIFIFTMNTEYINITYFLNHAGLSNKTKKNYDIYISICLLKEVKNPIK